MVQIHRYRELSNKLKLLTQYKTKIKYIETKFQINVHFKLMNFYFNLNF